VRKNFSTIQGGESGAFIHPSANEILQGAFGNLFADTKGGISAGVCEDIYLFIFTPWRRGLDGMNIHVQIKQNPRDVKKNYTPCGRRQRATRAPHKFAPCLDREL
jgi:hypothetical protein